MVGRGLRLSDEHHVIVYLCGGGVALKVTHSVVAHTNNACQAGECLLSWRIYP
jgi:hypothetical protein